MYFLGAMVHSGVSVTQRLFFYHVTEYIPTSWFAAGLQHPAPARSFCPIEGRGANDSILACWQHRRVGVFVGSGTENEATDDPCNPAISVYNHM